MNLLQKLGANENSLIHNTSWGFDGCHITFKNQLDRLYKNVCHSDIRYSELNNTMMYDITKKIEDKYFSYFDYVLNISTVEEVNYPNKDVICNLFEQVKPGGYLIITFDYDKNNCNTVGNGSINLKKLEILVNQKIINFQEKSILSGKNSIIKSVYFKHLNCGIICLKKML